MRVKQDIICFDWSVSSQLVSRIIAQDTGAARAVDPCDLVNAASTDDGCPVRMHILSPDFLQCGQRIGDEHNPCVVLLSQLGKGKRDGVDLGGHAGERKICSGGVF